MRQPAVPAPWVAGHTGLPGPRAVVVSFFTGKTPSETKRPIRQLLTAFGTNTPACWRAEDIDLVVETGRGCLFAWTMFQHPRHCASFRRHGESGLAVVVQGLIDLGQWSRDQRSDFRSTAACTNFSTSPMPFFPPATMRRRAFGAEMARPGSSGEAKLDHGGHRLKAGEPR
jgi:hypothetical protein